MTASLHPRPDESTLRAWSPWRRYAYHALVPVIGRRNGGDVAGAEYEAFATVAAMPASEVGEEASAESAEATPAAMPAPIAPERKASRPAPRAAKAQQRQPQVAQRDLFASAPSAK